MTWTHHLGSALQTLLPNHCYLCGLASRRFLCTGCENDLPRPSHSCECCALPLPASALQPTAKAIDALCGDCLQHPKPFTRTLAAFSYRQPIAFLINRFKHQRHFVSGRFMARALAAQIPSAYGLEPLPDALVPMPLHWRRRFERGYNQSALIAEQLRQSLALPVADLCRRTKRNSRQQTLKRAERLRNLRGAFSVCGDVEGRHLAIIDDVMTTGATATEAAQALLRAGASRVDIWVLARVE